MRCLFHILYVVLLWYGTNVTCKRTRTAGPPATFIGNWTCCQELLGPTTFNATNCFYCPGDADCVRAAL